MDEKTDPQSQAQAVPQPAGPAMASEAGAFAPGADPQDRVHLRANQDRMYKRALWALFGRMSLYYVAVALSGAAALIFIPGFQEIFPVGGVRELTGKSFGLFEASGAATAILPGSWAQTGLQLLLAMVLSLLLMLPVSWVHSTIHNGNEFDHSIDETALILPAVVAGIVTVVQHSLALAFSLAGIMAGVHFRRALDDTFDTLFIFVAIGVGLAAGVGAIEIAAVMTVFFNYATVLNCIAGDGLESRYAARRETARARKKQDKILKAQQMVAENAPPAPQSTAPDSRPGRS